jgi:hypothetical protein
MTMLGGVAVLVATFQSRGQPAFLAVLLPLTLVEPGLLLAMHGSLIQVVQLVDLSMAVILIGLGIFYFFGERIRRSAQPQAELGNASEQRIARSAVNQ